MQNSAAPATISMFTTSEDRRLWRIKTSIESSYWTDDQGVYEIQFETGNQPLDNMPGVMLFHVIRYTPDLVHDAFAISIPGIMKNDGSIEYGGGVRGDLFGDVIMWNDGSVWNRVTNVEPAKSDALSVTNIQNQATIDSLVMGNILGRYYYLDPEFLNNSLYDNNQ